MNSIKELQESLDSKAMLSMSLQDWQDILVNECQVFVCGENYLARRLNFINFNVCNKDLAEEILIDNLYLLLRNKYFKVRNDEIDKRISQIIDSVTKNIKSSLNTVTFDSELNDDVMIKVSYLPDYCLAFKNGVYNFKDNNWLFKYDTIKNEKTGMSLYLYDTKYIIKWYFKFDFEPLGLDIMNIDSKELINMFKELAKDKNYNNNCFKLLYNISHDKDHKFSLSRFEHLCEILGYTALGSFSQCFVMLVGSGSNGKNSLFDGCFKNRIYPVPSSVSLDTIEKDRFVTGTLENVSHNIYLETSAKTYTDSKEIKNLTGTSLQSVEHKGENRYSSIINCKFIFSCNDKENIKFTDTTTGFRRRFNVFEIFYQWDAAKRFLKKGDYYDSQFTDDLREFTSVDAIEFAYFAMFGIRLATNDFTSNFKFDKDYNDWTEDYQDINSDLKEKVESITMKQVVDYMKTGKEKPLDIFISDSRRKLHMGDTAYLYGIKDDDDVINFFSKEPVSISDEEYDDGYMAILSDHDLFISIKTLYSITKQIQPMNSFTKELKTLYRNGKFDRIVNNNNYVLCTFKDGKLKIITK